LRARWKAVIAIGAGILVSYLWQCNQPVVHTERGMYEVVFPTDSILYGEYAKYNKMYFGNTLPYATVQFVSILDDRGNHADSMADIRRDASIYHIRIDKAWNPILKTADISLLHEMCHVKLDANGEVPLTVSDEEAHGEKFQGCMKDLAANGAMHDLW
jgi:hypothetical protein